MGSSIFLKDKDELSQPDEQHFLILDMGASRPTFGSSCCVVLMLVHTCEVFMWSKFKTFGPYVGILALTIFALYFGWEWVAWGKAWKVAIVLATVVLAVLWMNYVSERRGTAGLMISRKDLVLASLALIVFATGPAMLVRLAHLKADIQALRDAAQAESEPIPAAQPPPATAPALPKTFRVKVTGAPGNRQFVGDLGGAELVPGGIREGGVFYVTFAGQAFFCPASTSDYALAGDCTATILP